MRLSYMYITFMAFGPHRVTDEPCRWKNLGSECLRVGVTRNARNELPIAIILENSPPHRTQEPGCSIGQPQMLIR
jgi:hypothetical protein